MALPPSGIPVKRGSTLSSASVREPRRSSSRVSIAALHVLDKAALLQIFGLEEPLSGGIKNKITPFPIPSEKIAAHPFSADLIAATKTLKLENSEVEDGQIGALVSHFVGIQRVILKNLPQITEVALQALGRLKGLRSVEISLCSRLRTLLPLPLEQLEKLCVVMRGALQDQAVERLVKSPNLKEVDFGYLDEMTEAQFFMFKKAASLHSISLELHQSRYITQDSILRLGLGRKGPPISIKRDPLPERPPILSIDAACWVASSSADISCQEPEKIQVASFYNQEKINSEAFFALRRMIHLEVLYVGKLQNVPSRTFELLLSEHQEQQPLRNLRELYIFDFPVSDEALDLMSKLPNLQKVVIVDCESFTLQGLSALAIKARCLKELGLVRCPSIDVIAMEQLRNQLPSLVFHFAQRVDSKAVELALAEASSIMRNPEEQKFYYFLDDKMSQVPEKQKIDCDKEVMTARYAEKLSLLGIADQVACDQWMRCDQILQAYINISRAAFAIRKELMSRGYFTQSEERRQALSVDEILKLLEDPKIVSKVRRFHFEELGLTRWPFFMLQIKWARLEEIDIEENFLERVPQVLSEQMKGRPKMTPLS